MVERPKPPVDERTDPPRVEDLSQDRGTLEKLFQETIRRALSLGLGGFFMTEEAVRRALNDTVPTEWVEFLNQQTEDVRGDMTDRLVKEFGSWLRSLDLADLLKQVLEDYEFSAKIELSARAKTEDGAASLKVVPRRK